MEYVRKVSPWIQAIKKKYPQITTILDVAPVWEKRSLVQDWNRELQHVAGDQIRMYAWDGYLYSDLPGLDTVNRIDRCFDQVLTGWIREFTRAFPGRKISILQWGLKPGLKKGGGLVNTVYGCLHVAKMYQWLIEYNRRSGNLIDYASYCNLNNLIFWKNDTPANYESVRLCGQLLTGKPNVLETRVEGVKGVDVVCCDGQGDRVLLLINRNNRTLDLHLSIDGVKMSSTVFH